MGSPACRGTLLNCVIVKEAALLRLQFELIALKPFKCFHQVVSGLFKDILKDNHVIQVGGHLIPLHLMNNKPDCSLENGGGVTQTQSHPCPLEESILGDEGCFVLVGFF